MNKIEVNGVCISSEFFNVSRGSVVESADGKWLVKTKKGAMIAEFHSKQSAVSWWDAFKTANRKRAKEKRRNESQLQKSKTEAASRVRAEKYADPLQPYSAKYDMPEIDLR